MRCDRVGSTRYPDVTGCPSTYAQDNGPETCALIVEGEILNKICRRDDMPALRPVLHDL